MEIREGLIAVSRPIPLRQSKARWQPRKGVGSKAAEHNGREVADQSEISFRQLREGAEITFDACMIMEYRMTQRLMEGGDFFEGVRAVVIDKDMTKWRPGRSLN